MSATKKKVAVIGCGIAGGGSIVSLKEEGHEPTCFEKTDRYGGTFCYRENSIPGVGSVMPTTSLNTNKEIGAISTFPPPREFSPYLRHSEFYQYISDFYKHHNCEKHIRFNTEVILVKKNHDYDETGRFLVTLLDKISNKTSTEIYDAVIVATGHFNIPKYATFEGQEKFKGTIIHTHSLKGVERYRGRNVLVIGSGCSALDAAVDCSTVAKKVYISSRTGCYIMSRVGPFGYPYDYVLVRKYFLSLFDFLPRNIVSWLFEKFFLEIKYEHTLYPVQPKYHLFSKDPVINDVIFCKLLSGAVVMKGSIKHFTENGVVFDGYETITEIDDVIFGTGYTFDFSFLEKGLIEINNGRIDLYKCVFPPQLKHPTLAVVGFLNPFGPGVPVGELQLRWIAQILSGECKLPSQAIMMKDIIRRYEKNKREYSPSEFNSIRVDYYQYARDIASEIGANPNVFKYMFTDFPLFWKLVFGPIVPYQFRLEGPHKWDEAREAIMTSEERLFYPLNKNRESRKSFLEILYNILLHLVPKFVFF